MKYNNYWSDSKLARLILPGKPKSGTMEEWNKWENDSKKANPYRYWLAEDVLNSCQDVVYWVPNKVKNVRRYFLNRFLDKTHTLTSNLKKGEFYEFETRVIHCLFDELVNYVEIELANHNMVCDSKAKAKYGRLFSFSRRNADAGLDYLDWEMTVTIDDNSANKEPKLSSQAIAAKEIKALYDWWKVTRPNRSDPYKLSGYDDLLPAGEAFLDLSADKERKKVWSKKKKALEAAAKLENNYEKEDEEMLIRLIKLRRSMWT